ncbi:hypothetical protein [Lysinibacillus fusiformis]|uniref:hypothetical protein n=1 Tax=Lysinibacillus fusiformis TaxID=28031 RepID=UPI003CFEE053
MSHPQYCACRHTLGAHVSRWAQGRVTAMPAECVLCLCADYMPEQPEQEIARLSEEAGR